MADPTYLDAQGNPIAGKVYLDDQGNPTAKPSAPAAPTYTKDGVLAQLASWFPAVGGGVGQFVGGTLGAGLGAAAGEGYRQLTQHAAEIPGAVADVARNLVTQPRATIQGALQGLGAGAIGATEQGVLQGVAPAVVGAGLGKVASMAAPALMQSAVKPGVKATAKALIRGSDLPVVQTLLDEGVNVSAGGIQKLTNIIDASNETIKDILNSIPESVKISPEAVAQRTAETTAKFSQQVDRAADVNAIKATTERFLRQNTVPAQVGVKQVPTGILDAAGQMITKEAPVMGRVAQDLSPLEAQAMKVGTYHQLKAQAYGALKPAQIEAQKALARGLKEEIASEAAKAGYNITAPNIREGAAIEAREAIAKRLAAAGNRDPAGLAWLAHNPVTATLYLMERSPAVKSMLARGLYSTASQITGVAPNVIRMAVAGVAASGEDQSK